MKENGNRKCTNKEKHKTNATTMATNVCKNFKERDEDLKFKIILKVGNQHS